MRRVVRGYRFHSDDVSHKLSLQAIDIIKYPQEIPKESQSPGAVVRESWFLGLFSAC
jgi:hypothetical protein